jgi:arginyl-tRNA synthetase
MFQKIEKRLLALLRQSVLNAFSDPALSSKLQGALDQLTLEIPKEKEFGDFSCSIAMKLAAIVRKNPRAAADDVVARLSALSTASDFVGLVDKVEVKGAGFINIFLQDNVYRAFLEEVNAPGARPGSYDIGEGEKVLLEFVSANPTGSLSIAHARQAAVGDALANVLSRVGFNVTREYYLNDAGNQINILGRSIDLRYQELAGRTVDFPEDHYQGSYIADLARVLYDDPKQRPKIDKLSDEPRAVFFRDYGVEKILAIIRQELDGFGVHFDVWYSQRKLDASGLVEKTLEALKRREFIYESEGAVWLPRR